MKTCDTCGSPLDKYAIKSFYRISKAPGVSEIDPIEHYFCVNIKDPMASQCHYNALLKLIKEGNRFDSSSLVDLSEI